MTSPAAYHLPPTAFRVQGAVKLDDPISMYLLEFSNVRVYDSYGTTLPADRPITIRHLLTHTSGLTYG